MKSSGLDVLYEDNHLLVVDKPAGVAVQGAAAGVPSLHRQAGRYLKEKYGKPGNVFVGIVHRLDKPVSGVVVLARTSKAAARLSKLFSERDVEKRYVAFVAGHAPDELRLRHFLRRGETKMIADVEPNKGGAEAILNFRCTHFDPKTQTSRLEIELETGRKHQIRCQLAAAGFPIVGDRKYGSHLAWPSGIALQCQRLRFLHPTRSDERLSFETRHPLVASDGKVRA